MTGLSRNSTRTLIAIVLLVSFSMLLPSICASQDSPPSFLVESDLKRLFKNDVNCGRCIRVTEVIVLNSDSYSGNATVAIEVRGDWLPVKDCYYVTGPCSGFTKAKGIGQTIRKTMVYSRQNSTWRLVSHQ